jgi:hypothetical protein
MTAGSDLAICPNSIATLAATSSASYTGIWRRIGGTNPAATITTPTSPTSTVTGIAASGTINLVWTLTDSAAANPTCITLRDTVKILVQGNANAGSAITACVGATVTLNATAPTAVATGVWSVVTAPVGVTPQITSASDPKSTVTGFSTPGAYTFRWTLTAPTCSLTTPTADVTVTINAAPSQAVILNPSSPTLALCQNTLATTLVGSTPATGTGNPSWTSLTNGIVTLTGSSNDTAKITPTGAGTTQLVYRITNVSGNTAANNPAFKCSTYDTLTVAVGPSNANAGPDQGFCASPLPTISLAATPVLAGETGAWSVVSGTASLTTPSSPTSIVTGVTPGTVALVWTVTAGTCVDTDTMKIIASAAPSVASVLSPDTAICVDDTISIRGSVATTGTATWRILQAGGTATVRFVPNTTAGATGATVRIRGRQAGTVTLYYIIAVGVADTSNACATYDSLKITVRPTPSVDPGNDISVCGTNTPIQLQAVSPGPGEMGTWSTVSGTAVVTSPHDTASMVTGATGTSVLKWTISTGVSGACTASQTIQVVVNPAPTVATSLTADTTVCVGATFTAKGSVPTVGTASWSALGSTLATVVSGAATPNAVIKANTAGLVRLRYRISNGSNSIASGCSTVDTLKLTIVSGGACAVGLWDTYTSQSKLSISPNPGNGIFLLSMPNEGNGNVDISVLNMEGKQVYVETSDPFSQKEIDLSTAPKGVYVVKVTWKDKTSTGKLIIQ